MTSQPLRGLRIGYVPYRDDLSAPGDRRRFCYYAALSDVRFERYEPHEKYDLIYLTTLADLTYFSRYPRDGTKIVYDLPDSYFAIDPREPKAMFRGTAKFLFRQHRHWEPSYHESLRRMCRRADLVLCSTPEQREQILPINANVHAILDYHIGDIERVKTGYSLGQPIRLLWEGLAGNIFTLGALAPVLAEIARSRPLNMHLLTDLDYRPVNGPLPRLSTRRLVDRYLDGVPTYVYEWNRTMFATICTACDLALIPIPMGIPIFRAKAENKLLLFWRMGIPTLTTATPAYRRTMEAAGVDMACASMDDWRKKIHHYLDHEDSRRAGASAGRDYADSEHGPKALTQKWDAAFRSIF